MPECKSCKEVVSALYVDNIGFCSKCSFSRKDINVKPQSSNKPSDDKVGMTPQKAGFIVIVSFISIIAFFYAIDNYGDEGGFIVIVGWMIIMILAQKFFWGILLGIATIASLFAMIASIIHFQIVGAVGFFVLMILINGLRTLLLDK